MKLKLKLALGFAFITSLVWVVGISSIIVTKSNITNTIEQYSMVNVTRITHYVNKDIFSKIEYFLGRTKGATLQKEVKKSNEYYSKVNDPIKLINSFDKEWIHNGNNYYLKKNLINNELSQAFIEESKLFEKENNKKIITEILVTDSLGALVAQTNYASDYYQADEEWWQKAKRDKIYVSDFIYDESSKTYATEICVRIEDKYGKFIGVLKATISIENILSGVKEYLSQSVLVKSLAKNYIIFDQKGRILFSRDTSFRFLDIYPMYQLILNEISNRKYLLEFKDNEGKGIIAFFRTIPGISNLQNKWVLVVEYKNDEIFSSTKVLTNQILIGCFFITIFGFIVSYFIANKMIAPLKSLIVATNKISEGDYNYNVNINSKDELSDLANAFNLMINKNKGYQSQILAQNEKLNQINKNLQEEIEKRELVQIALQNEKEKLDITLSSITDAVIATDMEGRVILINNAAQGLLGLSLANSLEKNITDIFKIVEFPERSFRELLDLVILHRHNNYTEQVTLVNCKNEKFVILNSIAPLIDVQGNVTGIVISFKDITEKNKIEKLLEESEKKFRELFDSSTLGIFRSIPEGRFLDLNPAAAKMFGYDSIEEMLQSVTDISTQIYADPKDREKIIEALKSGNGYGVFETNFRRKDGSILVGNLHIRLREDEQGKKYFEGFVEDITEKKLAEENFYRIFENTPEWITITTYEEGRYLIVNKAFEETFGYANNEVKGKTVKDIGIYLDYSDRERIKSILDQNYSISNLEIKLRKKNNEIITCLVSFERIIYKNMICLISIGRDITERIIWEEELAKEKERLAVTLRSIGDGVITTDIDGKITLMNRVAENLTGWKFEEALRKDLDDIFVIVDADTKKRRESPFRKVLNTNMISEIESNTLLLSKDGTEKLIADSGSPIKDKDSRVIGVVIVFRDITQRKKIENELQKMQKIESIGVLAGGLAHDFNNILTSIIGSIELALIKDDLEHKNKYLQLADSAALRAKGITQQLLTFSKGGEPIKKVSSIENVVKNSSSFASSGSNCEVVISSEENLWETEIDEDQISQVIQNMVLNSIQAMPEGGKIKIDLYNYELLEKDNQGLHGKYVAIKISDTGCGIEKDIIDKIFDPYFTTKKTGSGLGLAVSYSIIKKHYGFIEVFSEIGKGTDFIIYLPAVQSESQKEKEVKVIRQKGKGYILIMDDEEDIRNILCDILVYLGYEVDSTSNGYEALEKYKNAFHSNKPYDLVIMDLTIPGGLGGKETIIKLLDFDPGAKAIVSSGYSNDPVMAEYRKYGFLAAINKPYRLEEVKKTLKSILVNE